MPRTVDRCPSWKVGVGRCQLDEDHREHARPLHLAWSPAGNGLAQWADPPENEDGEDGVFNWPPSYGPENP